MKTLVLKEKQVSLEPEETLDFFAFTGKGPVKEIEKIRRHILSLPNVELIYQKRSCEYLFITKQNPSGDHQK